MNNRLNNHAQGNYQEENGFWNDELNQAIAFGLFILVVFLFWKCKPWRFIFKSAEGVNSVATASFSKGMTNSISSGLSINQMVSML